MVVFMTYNDLRKYWSLCYNYPFDHTCTFRDCEATSIVASKFFIILKHFSKIFGVFLIVFKYPQYPFYIPSIIIGTITVQSEAKAVIKY